MKPNKPNRFIGTRGKQLLLTAVLLLVRDTGAAAPPDFRTDINPALIYFQAYQQMPAFNEADSKYLDEAGLRTPWPEHPLDERALRLIHEYDNSFKLIRRARFSRIPCDWGYDLSDGPEALLGGLAPAKRLMQIAKLRARVALDHHESDAFVSDLAAAHALGRNLATDRVLISALVQFAIEDILNTVILENYYRISAGDLDELFHALDSAPPRGTIAATIPTEHDAFYGYILRKVQGLIRESKSDGQFWTRFAEFWNPLATDPESGHPDPRAEAIQKAADGRPGGVIDLLQQLPPLYERVQRLAELSFPEYQRQIGGFTAEIDRSTNPFIKQLFPVLLKVRIKEFRAILHEGMLRAALAYKKQGMEGLRSARSPLDGGVFEFHRVSLDGVDRGFALKASAPLIDGEEEALIFLEKPGKPIHLIGKNAGTARE